MNEKKSAEDNSGFSPCVINKPCQTIKTIAPVIQKMIKEMNNPLHIPLLTFNALISSIDFWYFPKMKSSFVKDLTFEIPIKASSTIELDSAAKF